jgi:hypothetical protein
LIKKKKNKLATLEAQADYIENILKKVDTTQKQNEINKMIEKSVKK